MQPNSSPSLKKIVRKYVYNDIELNDYAAGTIKNHVCYYRSFKKFLKHSGLSPTIQDVDHDLIDKMCIFLRADHSLTNVARTVHQIRNAMDYARRNKLIPFNHLSDYKPKKGKVKEVIHLEENELDKMMSANNLPARLDKTRSVYLAQAITGMSYGDLKNYKIVIENGARWLVNKRCKSNIEYWVPLDKVKGGHLFLEIHDKYNGLPVVNVYQYNQNIRLLSESLGITKYLTSHTARKTFATRSFEDGWSCEAIALMMGITVQVLLTHYIKRSRRRLENEVKLRPETV